MVHSLPSKISVPAASPSLQPFNDTTDPLWAKYHEHCNHFAWLIGHEVTHRLHKTLDFKQALNDLAAIQPYGVDGAARSGLAHTMNILGAYGTRFDDNRNLKPHQGENSATHSIMAVLLSDYILNRAEQAGADPETLQQFRKDAAISLLLHDAGEAFGEFSTKSEQVQNPKLKEDKTSLRKYEAEYLVLRYVLTQSLRVAAGEITEDNFNHDIKSKRETLGFNASPRQSLETRMDAFRHELNVDNAPLTPELLATRNQLMHYWVATEISPHLASAKKNAQSASASPELRERFALFEKLAAESAQALHQSSPRFTPEYGQFLGNYAKMIDDIQGARHYNKFLRENQKVSEPNLASTTTPLAPKSEIIAREDPQFYLGMLEKNLPGLHESAKALPWASPIASWVSALSYQTASASIELMHPPDFPLNQYKHQVKNPRATESDKERSRVLQMRAEQGWWSAVYKNARDAAIDKKIEPTTDFVDARVRNYLGTQPPEYTLPDTQAATTLGFPLPSFPEIELPGKAKI